jgi:glycosyltransferase involved in cell wall biosynthesis
MTLIDPSFRASPLVPFAGTTTYDVVVPTAAEVRTAGPRIRGLHLINGEHFSGAERVQQWLGKRLPELGVDIEFVCLKEGKFPSHSGLPRERIHVCPMRNRTDIGVLRYLQQLVSHGDFQILHAHTPRTALLASLLSRACWVPWVYHVHSPAGRDSTRAWINRLNHWTEAWCLRNCTKIVTVSRSLRRDLLRQGWSRQRLVTIANGVAEQPAIDADARSTTKAPWRLGMVALFRPRKGLEGLLEALAMLPQDSPPVVLDVIGGFETEEYRQAIDTKIDRLGIRSRIRIHGFVSNVPEIMRQLDAMVLPSLFGEGMPMVVLEALACGVPVIATSVEGTPEVVRDGIEGVLAVPNDPASLRDAIVRFTRDRRGWVAMSRRAFQRHRAGYTDLRMAEKLARVYRRILIERGLSLPVLDR